MTCSEESFLVDPVGCDCLVATGDMVAMRCGLPVDMYWVVWNSGDLRYTFEQDE
jgi:hypothetical protein